MSDMVQSESITSLSEAAQEALERSLTLPDARQRRDDVDQEDPRGAEELETYFESLDALIGLLEVHIAEAATRQMEVPKAKEPRPFVPPDPPPNDPMVVADQLYEDIVWLFAVNDGEGALISLERMLQMGEPKGEAKEFVDGNEAKLLQLYEDYMGPFDKWVSRGPMNPREDMPSSYLTQGSLSEIYELVAEGKTIQDMMDESPLSPLLTCATLKQLHRSHAVEIS
ncbi:MAG: hypothetical protein VX938_07600 [Myxococcota bacterium]|nr:hypothetical protein [Myxococcota bacterium]